MEKARFAMGELFRVRDVEDMTKTMIANATRPNEDIARLVEGRRVYLVEGEGNLLPAFGYRKAATIDFANDSDAFNSAAVSVRVVDGATVPEWIDRSQIPLIGVEYISSFGVGDIVILGDELLVVEARTVTVNFPR